MSNVLPTFVDLQGFIVRERFTVKEVAVLKAGKLLTHHVFCEPISWNLLTRAEKSQACWLIANHHSLQWTDGDVNYGKARTIVRRAIFDGTESDPSSCKIVYVKGLQKKEWLRDILGRDAIEDSLSIETLDADFDNVDRLETLDAAGTFRCSRHSKNCAMENVNKMYNWWVARQQEMSNL